jgi:hypothetical protein
MDHVRSIIIEYLAGRFAADQLPTRLPDVWELEEGGDVEAHDLVLRAVGYLAEYERGDRAEPDLRAALIPLVVSDEASTLQATKTKVVVFGRMAASQPVGKALLEVSA